MSEDKQLKVDESELEAGKSTLQHTETKQGSNVKSVLHCTNCSNEEPVPDEWADMDDAPAMPNCSKCGTQMQIKIQAN